MKTIEVQNNKYELIKDYKNAFVYFNKALDASVRERNIWAY